MENLYPIDEAAKKLGGISRHTVVAWLAQGKLRRTKVCYRTMISESELQRFVNISTQRQADDAKTFSTGKAA